MAMGIRQWFRIAKRDQVSERKVKLYNLMEKQRQVGWNFFIRGLVLNDWAYWQEQEYKRRGIPKMGDSWSASITEWWIRQSRKVWNTRNEKVHNTTKENESRAEEEAFAQVRRLYETSHLLSAQDRELFNMSMEDIMNQPLATLQIWIQNAWPTVKTCVQRHTERLLLQNQRLSEFISSSEIGYNNCVDNNTMVDEVQYEGGEQDLEHTITFSEEETADLDDRKESCEDTPPADINQENERILIYDISNSEDDKQQNQTSEYQQNMIDGQ